MLLVLAGSDGGAEGGGSAPRPVGTEAQSLLNMARQVAMHHPNCSGDMSSEVVAEQYTMGPGDRQGRGCREKAIREEGRKVTYLADLLMNGTSLGIRSPHIPPISCM